MAAEGAEVTKKRVKNLEEQQLDKIVSNLIALNERFAQHEEWIRELQAGKDENQTHLKEALAKFQEINEVNRTVASAEGAEVTVQRVESLEEQVSGFGSKLEKIVRNLIALKDLTERFAQHEEWIRELQAGKDENQTHLKEALAKFQEINEVNRTVASAEGAEVTVQRVERLEEQVSGLGSKLEKIGSAQMSPSPAVLEEISRNDKDKDKTESSISTVRSLTDKLGKAFVDRQLSDAMVAQDFSALNKAVEFAQDLALEYSSTTWDKATRELESMKSNILDSLTLLYSNYRAIYSEGSPVRKEFDANESTWTVGKLSAKIKAALIAQRKAANKAWTDSEIDEFIAKLQEGITDFVRNEGLENPDIVQWAIYVWTSAAPLLENREFCAHFNEIIRTDDHDALRHLMPYVFSINRHLLNRGNVDRNAKWPRDELGHPVRRAFRGCGIPRSRWNFFQVGRRLRVPGGFATSLKNRTARNFAKRSSEPDKVLIEVRFNRHCADPAACKHIAFVEQTMVPGESEFLFVPFSKFEVLEVEERHDSEFGTYLALVLEAAEDNMGEELLPVVAWI